jgi:hypothetical protein
MARRFTHPTMDTVDMVLALNWEPLCGWQLNIQQTPSQPAIFFVQNFAQMAKKEKEYHFTYSLVLGGGGGICQISKKKKKCICFCHISSWVLERRGEWGGVGIFCTSFLTFWTGCRNLLPFNAKSLFGCSHMTQH